MPKTVLLCVHGLGLNSASYENFGRRMSGLGIATYAVDVRGFGTWMKLEGKEQVDFNACIDDVGRCINPLIVDGQTHGAIAQGVGQAMWEQIYLDPDSGQPLTGSLMDYGMPRADILPSFKTEIAEVLSPTNPLGIKAGGEGGTTAAPAVMVSGILDALREVGVHDIDMPVTPFKVWQAIQAAKHAIPGREPA